MSSERASVAGECPVCQAELSRHRVIIVYERSDGERTGYAECPDCRTVVRPA